jgi:hypothetical protein
MTRCGEITQRGGACKREKPCPFHKKALRVETWDDKLKKWAKGQDFPQPSRAVFWETTPIMTSQASLGPYRDSLYNAPSLNGMKVDTKTFNLHPRETRIITNLSGDCQLVVPPTKGEYTHLALFAKRAPLALQREFWKVVASAIRKEIKSTSQKRLWVSTHGSGVGWLHVRICKEPRYFHK